MARTFLPPGFRFHPTDVELVRYYLKRKVVGKPLCFEAISEIELYKFSPWDLPEKSCLQSKDLEWFFFCARDRKYANGQRANRSTERGYWKTTGRDRPVCHNSQTVGMKKTLVFHVGRVPRGDRTDWVMHEYRLDDQELVDAGIPQDAFVLCKIFKKSGPGPKNGEQHGAPFREEDWDDDAANNSSLSLPLAGSSSPSPGSADGQNMVMTNCATEAGIGCDSLMEPHPRLSPVVGEEDPSLLEYFNVNELLSKLSDKDIDASASHGSHTAEKLDQSIPCGTVAVERTDPLNNDEIFNGLDDITSHAELNMINKLYTSNVEDEHVLHQMPLNVGDSSYLELNDLQFPIEDDFSEFGKSNDLFAHSNPLDTPASGIDDLSSNLEHQAVMHGPAAPSVQTAEEIANESVTQALLGGEQHEVSSILGHLTNGGAYLLGSIPAHPAAAAEYPFSLGMDDSKGGNPCCGSSIHVKAEVTVACVCTIDVTAEGKPRNFPCTSCYGGKPSRKCPGDPSFHGGGGFMFVFLLGVVSALMWLFILAMSAKLGRCAWKHFLSW
ncbi:NAC domain-containing protein 82-like [Magnolia sinica]|uniref:NAC domain-containing protein 82-like n=1 Tax=Magnolia sinica TaxID=86752 RepID=UPI002657DB68|nr:NAC domain-containing protein 82-like [Magnolia sinica]